jgi:hypothetical protein
MTEAERLARLAHEFSTRVGGAVKDMIPPEAQHHLLNAQRELLTALFLIYEHQAAARRSEPAPRQRPRTRTAGTRARGTRAADRLDKIDIE